jgi:hypothetical protein
MSCNLDVTFGRWLSDEWKWILSSVNAIASLSIYCIYLMHSLRHILLDHYDYLMMQSCLWQMVQREPLMMSCLTFLRDPLRVDVAMDSPLVAMHRRHPRIHRTVWSSYWPHRMSSWLCSFIMRHVKGQNVHSTPDIRT